jgi:hypothetical protein
METSMFERLSCHDETGWPADDPKRLLKVI